MKSNNMLSMVERLTMSEKRVMSFACDSPVFHLTLTLLSFKDFDDKYLIREDRKQVYITSNRRMAISTFRNILYNRLSFESASLFDDAVCTYIQPKTQSAV